MLILKARKNTLEVSADVPHLSYDKLCDNMAVSVGGSPETEHCMCNWIKPFFHICVGVKEGERRWEASVLNTGDYWPLALIDSRKCFFCNADRCQSCARTAVLIKLNI